MKQIRIVQVAFALLIVVMVTSCAPGHIYHPYHCSIPMDQSLDNPGWTGNSH